MIARKGSRKALAARTADRVPTVPTFVARAHGMANIGPDSELKLTQEQLKSLYGCLLRFQIERGDDVNKRDKDGDTLLYTAITTGHASAVSMLLAAGADVNTKGYKGSTPLDDAIGTRRRILHPKTADLLRKHGGKTGAELEAEGK